MNAGMRSPSQSDSRDSNPVKEPGRWLAVLARGIVGTTSLPFVGYLLWKERLAGAASAFAGIVLVMLVIRPIGYFFSSLLRHAEKRLNRGAERLGERAVDELVRLLRRGWEIVFSRFRHKYCKDLEFALRTYRTQGLQQNGPFTLDLEHVFVPLRISPNSPSRISASLVASGHCHETQQIWEFLNDSAQDAPRRLALLARPGAGKTTLLEHLALTFARGTQRRFHAKAPRLLPILFYLRDIRKDLTQGDPPHLPELLNAALSQRKNVAHDLTPPDGWFDRKLAAKHSRCLVMFDGLDEVAGDDERLAVCRWVDQQMQRYPEARFLLTSRPQGYTSAPCKHIEVILEVQPFSTTEIKCFIDNWFLQNEVMRQRRQKDAGVKMVARKKSQALVAEIERSAVLTELAVNPLLLTMITTVRDSQGAVPESRVALYKEICEVLLVRRQREKGLTDEVTALRKQALLQHLALNLMRSGGRTFTLDQGEECLAPILGEVVGANVSTSDFIEGVARRSGLLVERERGQYEFSHKSFQEYLAAREVKETRQEALLLSHFGEDWWEETIRLYAAQSDTGPFIQAALNDPTAVKLALACDCMKEGLRTPGDLREKLENKLERALESERLDEARLAAEVKLTQRLRSLIRIEEGVQLDSTLLTCAEYQLFVDHSPEHSPIHWQNRHFPRGQARTLVVGVWPEAARAFCYWLTQRDLARRRYRLPTETESMAHPLREHERDDERNQSSVGHWCINAGETHLTGLALEQLSRMARELEVSRDELVIIGRGFVANSPIPAPSELERHAQMLDLVWPEPWPRLDYAIAWLRTACLDADCKGKSRLLGLLTLILKLDDACGKALCLERALAGDRDLARDLAGAVAGDFAVDLAGARALAGTLASACAENLGTDLDLDLERAGNVARDLALTIADASGGDSTVESGRSKAVEGAPARALALEIDRVFALERARAYVRTLSHDLELIRERARDCVLTLAHDLDRTLAHDLDRTLAHDLDRTLSHDTNRAHETATLSRIWMAYREGDCLPGRTPGTQLPMGVLGSLLELARQSSAESAAFFDRAMRERDIRRPLRKSRDDCLLIAQNCTARAQTLERLNAWVRLFAAREEKGHPGWEGLRIVCQSN